MPKNPFDGVDSSVCRAMADIMSGRLVALLSRDGALASTNQPARSAAVTAAFASLQLRDMPASADGFCFVSVHDDLIVASDGDPAALAGAAHILRKVIAGRAARVRDDKLHTLGSAASRFAHDINNILAVIVSMSDLLLEDNGDRSDLVTIRDAADQAASMTREVLSFATSKPTPTDRAAANEDGSGPGVNATLASFAPVLRGIAGDGVHLKMDLDSRAGAIALDGVRLKNIVANLVTNARDANASKIVVSTRAAGGRVCVAVEDDGVGMSAATLARAFEPFFTTKERGTGLGLATVRDLIQSAGGQLLLDSVEHAGTVCRIELPMARAPVTVLVAEDDDAARELIGRVLEHAGFHVVSVRDGREALTVLADGATPVSLALLDVRMPHFTGPEVAAKLAVVRPEVPTLFVSAHADLGERAVRKPFVATQLVDAVRSMLRA